MLPVYNTQINYIEKIVKLKLQYSSFLFYQKKISVKNALNNYCDIYRKTDLYSLKNQKFFPKKKIIWNKLVNEISNLLDTKKKVPLSSFINRAYEILLPRLLARINKKYGLQEYKNTARFGCFDYNMKDKKIDLHNINNKIPNSPFKKKKFHRLKDLLNLVKHSIKKNPRHKVIQCGSWMNTFYPFLELFPHSWKATGKFQKKNSLAWWGQFVDSSGGIHAKNSKQFLKNFKFPHPGEYYECNIYDLKEHIIFLLKNE